MAPHGDRSLDDIQVLGPWNFTLQGDTPLYWLRTGQLDRYLLKFRVSVPSPCTAGFVLHAEVDGPGTDGASFWIDRRPSRDGREGTRRYCLVGDGLDSSPIATRPFPDHDDERTEEVELMMEGYNGTIFLQERRVVLRFRMSHSKGSLGFYNSTRGDSDDVHFAGVRITAMRRGPLEIDGKFLARERKLEKMGQERAGAEEGKRRASSQASTPKTHAGSAALPTEVQRPTAGGASFGGRPVTEFRSSLANSGSSQLLPAASPAGSPMRSTMEWGSRGKSAPRLQASASESSLRTLGARGPARGFGEASQMQRPRRGEAARHWVPLALNAPAGEQALLKSVPRKLEASRNACNDFIPM